MRRRTHGLRRAPRLPSIQGIYRHLVIGPTLAATHPASKAMKIAKIELYYVQVPLSGKRSVFSEHEIFHPNWIPGFHQSDMRFYLLRLVTDIGLDGVAAMPAMGRERLGMGDLFGAYLLGLNPLDVHMFNQRIQEFAYLGIRVGWVDAAFWDLVGKIQKRPIWDILGGSGGYAYPYASLGSNYDHDPRVVASLVRARREQGFRGVKIRVKSRDLARMTDVVAAARDAGGDSMELMVDANLGWPVELLEESPRWDVEFAATFAQAIEPYRVAWLEEPIHRGDFEALSSLRKRTKTPIAGAEMGMSWRDYKVMLDMGCLDVYQPDAVLMGGTYAGGISVVYWLLQAIERRNAALPEGQPRIRYTPHMWTTGLGFAVNMQLFGLVPPESRTLLEYPYDVHWRPDQWASFIRGGFPRDAEGRIRIPEGPGLGVEIDWDVIRRFGKRIYVGTKATVAARSLLDQGWTETMYLRKKKMELIEARSQVEFKLPEPPF
jgi:L-alanine-DL-glutamate epimerase-like enolase superfamily enzyme